MLRLSAAPLSGRFGGWALIDSPPRRIASTGQEWSLAIAVAAALVAILAVVFDLRLASDIPLPAVLTTPTTVETTQRAVAEVAPPPSTTTRSAESSGSVADAPARPTTTTTPTTSERTATASPATTGSTERTGAGASATDDAAATTGAGAESSTTSSSTEATAAAAVVDDPATRIRDYLGLHAGAQLPVSFAYEVQAGDTAISIAERFGLEESTVLFNNFDIYDANQLSVGQVLTLPSVNGLVYTVQSGDSLDLLVQNFQASLEATLAYPGNGISSADQIFVGQQLLLVHGSASVASSTSGGTSGGGQSAAVWTVPAFVWPLGFEKISDLFGTPRANSVGYHTGVDFIAAVGTIVGSAAAGQVTVATWDPSYGNWIELDHGGGYRSRYAHLDEIWVREGEWVASNAYIGTVGNTGNSSGAHLHFEIIIDGQAVNPLAWLN